MYNCLILADWVKIGGKTYDFNSARMTHSEASAMCKKQGGKLFEPRDEKTNKEVFEQAGKKQFMHISSASSKIF